MERDCFAKIKIFLRFDNKDSRRHRMENDKFLHIQEILEAFTSNCLYNFSTEWRLTIDEQLFSITKRCPFIVYMPNKPDEFGMKFWVLAEVSSKYACNILPYLGALEKEQRNGKPLAEDVVMRLTKSFYRKGYNSTTDNFFTTVKVAGLMQEKGTTLIGTVRANVKGIPKEINKGGNEKFSSTFFFNDDKKCMLVNYQCNQKKNAHLMSTMHDSPATNITKKKETTCYSFSQP